MLASFLVELASVRDESILLVEEWRPRLKNLDSSQSLRDVKAEGVEGDPPVFPYLRDRKIENLIDGGVPQYLYQSSLLLFICLHLEPGRLSPGVSSSPLVSTLPGLWSLEFVVHTVKSF